MPHSYFHVAAHIIFTTKNRNPWLNQEVRTRLFEYITGIIRNVQGKVIQMNGTEDHVHILALLPKDMGISDFIRTIKANSSKWMHETYEGEFHWQIGYGIFSVSKSNIPQVKEYIQNQEEHHKKIDYQEEFNKFLIAHGYPVINDHNS